MSNNQINNIDDNYKIINDWFLKLCEGKILTSTDINEHLPTLKRYTEECKIVVELGVRNIISTWAFLAGKPETLISIDIVNPEHQPVKPTCTISEIYEIAKNNNVNFEFRQENTLVNDIPQCDLLFIDTYHTYNQLRAELFRHSSKSNKYIILHDTVSFGINGEDGGKGLQQAVNEFLMYDKKWKVHEVFTNNNGLTILRRLDESI
jgi:hypothetical protein